MIKNFKKVFISSILSAVLILGAAIPMASAATAPNSGTRTAGFQNAFNAYDNGGSVLVYNIDYDITKVELYNQAGTLIRSAENTNTAVPGSQVTSGQAITTVEFKKLLPGYYSVAAFAGTIKSATQGVTVGLMEPLISASWSIAHKGTVTVTNLVYDPALPTKVTLVSPYNNTVIVSPQQTVDSTGTLVFTDLPERTYYKVLVEYTALGGFYFRQLSNAKFIAVNDLGKMVITTDSLGNVTVKNAVPDAEVRLYHFTTTTTTGNDTVTQDVYKTAIAPNSGIVIFPLGATDSGRYRVIEIGNAGGDRSQAFTIEPKAPTLALTSTGTGIVVTGALPKAYIKMHNNITNSNTYGQTDENGNATFDQINAGTYTAVQSPEDDSCVESPDSNAITVQKWMSHYLAPGWNTLSVPYALQTATLQAILGSQFNALDKAYAYDTAASSWVALTTANQSQYLSKPMTALYVNIKGNDLVRADFVATTDITPPPTLRITTGWNLVGPSLLYIDDSPREFLVGNSSDVIPMLVSPNGSGFVYTGNNNNNNYYDVTNTLGYWVYAKSATNLIGQVSTGTVNWPYAILDWKYNNYSNQV